MLQRDSALVHDLVASGVLCCLNAGSLTDAADRRSRAAAWKLLAGGLAHAIASDFHDLAQRPPQLGSTLEAVGLSASEIDYFTCDTPEAIISGRAVAPPPEIGTRRPRRWFRRGRP